MTRLAEPADRICDVLVAGAGLAGLAAAIAFGEAGFDVVACGADERLARGRTVAMLDRSIAYLDFAGPVGGDRAAGRADAGLAA